MDIDRTIVGVLSRFTARAVVSSYFLLQGLGVAAWWLLLLAVPESRAWFFPESLTGAPLMSFWLADIGLLCGGSLLASWLVWTHNPAASPAAWFLAGAWYYPAIYCMTVSLKLGGGELGVAAMFVGGGLTLAKATVVGQINGQACGFRPCSSSLVWTGIKTCLQIVVFWGTFFIVLPYTILALETAVGLSGFDFPWRVWVGGVLFAAFGAIGLSSAIGTLIVGRGTPLPTDCASVLVVSGPYRYVRNPMALAGIVQGVMMGVMLGSWLVMLYAVCGGVMWHVLVRPIEEADLLERFGESYAQYKAELRCWLPRFGRKDSD
jgi:protein-S-isoprenylcysteine O-methyltransferase Ste14